MKSLAKFPGVYWRASGYSYRKRVPVMLQSVFGKSEFVLSLKTRQLRIANQRASVIAGQVQQVFAEVTTQLGQLDHSAALKIADSWKHRTLNDDFEQRLGGNRIKRLDATSHQTEMNRLFRARHQMQFAEMQSLVDSVASQHQVDVSANSTDWQRLAYYLTQAQIQALEEIYKRDTDPAHGIEFYQEESAVTPANSVQPPISPETPSRVPTLSNALELWKEDSERPKRTELEWGRAIRVMIETVGDKPVNQITKADIRAFKKVCVKLPKHLKSLDRKLTAPQLVEKYKDKDIDRISLASCRKMLSAVRSVLQVCVENGDIDENPVNGLGFKKEKSKTKKRNSYTQEDLKAIFEKSPVFAERARPRGGAGEAAFWIPVIALYTGARLEEIGQLRLSDIKTEGDIVYLDLNTDHPDKSLKTESSHRKVPLHKAVLKLGFDAYLEKMHKRRNTHLFPFLNHEKETCTAAFSKWVNRYLRDQCGIDDKRKVFHCFRHTFKDACREARMKPDVNDALTGHSDGSVGQTYGDGHSLKILNEAIQTICYEDLEISTLGN